MKENNNEKQSWWATLPGILTGIAALITAVVALMSILKKDNTNIHTKPQIPVVEVDTSGTTTEVKSTTQATTLEKDIRLDFMKGNWKNYFGDGGAFEDVRISEDGNYYVNGNLVFVIEDFDYNKNTQTITFVKRSKIDTRILKNTLNVKNDDLLEGTEENYNVKYEKQADVKVITNAKD